MATITCSGANEVIDITDVLYGRENNDFCQGTNSATLTDCRSTTAQASVEALCENQPTCSLVVSNAVLGEEPCPGVFKQFEVTYCCADLCDGVTCSSPRVCSFGVCICPTGTAEPNCGACPNIQTTACENDELTITCSGANEVIANTDIIFGRVNADECVGPNYDTVTDCISADAPAAITSACDGQSTCTLIVTTANLGVTDPCPGVFKQVILDYCCADLCDGVTCSSPRVCSFGVCVCPTGTAEPNCGACPNIQTTACENDELTITCSGANEVVANTDVIFGRVNADECVGPNYDTVTDCLSADALAAVQDACEGQSTCSLDVTTANLGGTDPCPGVFKQVILDYCCVDLCDGVTCSSPRVCSFGVCICPTGTAEPNCGACPNIQTTACENDELTITCSGANEVIANTDIIFGRVNADECVGPNYDTVTDCISTDAPAAIQSACDGHSTCTLDVTTANLGGTDPCPGVFKQVILDYCCADLCDGVTCPSSRVCSFGVCVCPTGTAEPSCDACPNIQTTACENDELTITCSGANEVIANTDIIFGRVNADECVGPYYDMVTDCISADAPAVIQAACEGQSTCTLDVTTANLGGTDPCPGVFKQVILDYCCVDLCASVTCSSPRSCSFGTCECPAGTVEPDCSVPLNPATSKIACEGETLQITCTTGTIKILDAFFGRDNDDQCSGTNSDVTTDCSLATAMSTVVTACEQMKTCSLLATTATFTDPCPGTFKYLSVECLCALPTISCPSDMQVECDPSTCGSMVTWADPPCDDGFGGTVTVTCSPSSGQTLDVGSDVTVHCTCVDQFGQTDTCSFQVIVTDPTFVVITSNPQHSGPNGVSGLLAIANTALSSIAITEDNYGHSYPMKNIYFESNLPCGKSFQITAPKGKTDEIYGTHKVSFTDFNGKETRVTTFVKRKTDLLDTRGVYTKTIYPHPTNPSLLDVPLQFGVKSTINNILWYKDGTRLAHTGPKMKLTLTDNSAGLYTLQRKGRGRKAWCVHIQIILSDCHRGYFTDDPSSPCGQSCACGSCPGVAAQCPCLNGGVCKGDGKCQCPPCFTGRHCEKAKLNQYEIIAKEEGGRIVRFTCDDVAEDGECRCNLFCYGGNYGCSCGCGWKGNNCNIKCPLGWYGADCKQKCNCLRDNLCSRVTGACKGGCPAGFSGFNCQIPVGLD